MPTVLQNLHAAYSCTLTMALQLSNQGWSADLNLIRWTFSSPFYLWTLNQHNSLLFLIRLPWYSMASFMLYSTCHSRSAIYFSLNLTQLIGHLVSWPLTVTWHRHQVHSPPLSPSVSIISVLSFSKNLKQSWTVCNYCSFILFSLLQEPCQWLIHRSFLFCEWVISCPALLGLINRITVGLPELPLSQPLDCRCFNLSKPSM